MAGMEFDSNVLAAIARGVQLNPLGQLAEGWQEGLKRRQAQQALEENIRNNKAMEDLKQQDLAKPDPIPAEIQLLMQYQKNPELVGNFLSAKRPYVPMGAGGALDTSSGDVINPAPKTTRVTASTLNGLSKAKEELTDLNNTEKILMEAYDLAPKAFAGFGAGARANVIQGVTGITGGGTFDKSWEEGAKATKEYAARMTPEALKRMNRYLKPVTEKEMGLSIETLADKNADADTKQAVINMLLRGVRNEQKSKAEELSLWEREAQAGEVAPPPGRTPPPPNTGAYAPPPGFETFKEGQRYRDKRDGKVYRKVNGQAVPE